ncbi:MAG: VWA domain-containing protein [bacterium]|nr:VWA domain-containing protein [bacterium]
MKKTELIFIIDSSGSMAHLADDTIGGFNAMLQEHRSDKHDVSVTTITFDSNVHVIHKGVDIRDVSDLSRSTYHPGGLTSLLDAIGYAIDSTQTRFDNMPVENRPTQVLCVILTDGQENSSTRYNKAQIQSMIKHQDVGHGWKFMFLGADMDAVADAHSYGITTAASYSATDRGIDAVYTTLSSVSKGFVADGVISSSWADGLSITNAATTDATITNIDALSTKNMPVWDVNNI